MTACGAGRQLDRGSGGVRGLTDIGQKSEPRDLHRTRRQVDGAASGNDLLADSVQDLVATGTESGERVQRFVPDDSPRGQLLQQLADIQ